jgi:hypothetical protein
MKNFLFNLIKDELGLLLVFILSGNYSRWAILRILPALCGPSLCR